MINYDIITLGCTDPTTYAKVLEINNSVVGQRSKFYNSQLMITVLWQMGVTKAEKFTYTLSPKSGASTLRVDMIDVIPSSNYTTGDLIWVYNTNSQKYEIYIKGRNAYGQGARILITCEEQSALIVNPRPTFLPLTTTFTINNADTPNTYHVPTNIDTVSDILQFRTGSVYLSQTSHNLTIEGYNGTRVHRVSIQLITRATGEMKTATIILYEGGIRTYTSDGITAVDNGNGSITINGLSTGAYLQYQIQR